MTPRSDTAAAIARRVVPKRWGGKIRLDPAVATGLIDGSVVLAYLVGLDFADTSNASTLWYSAELVAKLGLLAWFRRELTPLGGPAKAFLLGSMLMVAATMLSGAITINPYLNAAGFLAHLTFTLMLVGRRIRPYLAGALAPLAASAAIHIAFCFTHRVGELWGRYLYFGNGQPNLGGEIEAAGALAAAYTLKRVPALLVLALLLVDMALLQSRSAILVVLALAAVVVLHDPARKASLKRTSIVALITIVAVICAVFFDTGGKVFGAFDSLLLITNEHRGVDSGASGRFDLWQTSIDLFSESPLYGHALGYFPTINYIGAHNLILLGLAQFGVMSSLFFGALLYAYGKLLQVDPYRFWVLIAALPLFMFNDRMLNLNPYPFLIYAIFLLPGPVTSMVAVRARGETFARLRRSGPAASAGGGARKAPDGSERPAIPG